MNNYFGFTLSSDFIGSYEPVTNSTIVPIGNTKDPNDILKLNVGTDAWSQTPELITFSNINLDIESLSGTDWTTEQKDEWLESYIKHIGLENKLNPTHYAEILAHTESLNLFEHLSAPSIAYVNRNDGTNGYNDDNYFSNEVFIGLNVYENNFIKDYADTLPISSLRDIIYNNHKLTPTYISNACKVTYNGYTDIVWAFENIHFSNYDISNIGITPSLTNGGGNMFAEVKLAGKHLQAHYKVRKNVNSLDPTMGYVSGEDKPFCMGDQIVIIDTTTWSEDNGTRGWTWVGDFSVLNYTWHISDVTKPCIYYKNVPIFDQLFPLRIISFCVFDSFG